MLDLCNHTLQLSALDNQQFLKIVLTAEHKLLCALSLAVMHIKLTLAGFLLVCIYVAVLKQKLHRLWQ